MPATRSKLGARTTTTCGPTAPWATAPQRSSPRASDQQPDWINFGGQVRGAEGLDSRGFRGRLVDQLQGGGQARQALRRILLQGAIEQLDDRAGEFVHPREVR